MAILTGPIDGGSSSSTAAPVSEDHSFLTSYRSAFIQRRSNQQQEKSSTKFIDASAMKSGLSRQWSNHAGRITEHVDPDEQSLTRRAFRWNRYGYPAAPVNDEKRMGGLQGYEEVRESSDDVNASSGKHVSEFTSMEAPKNETSTPPPHKLWDSAKHGISVGFDSAGHKLGLWDGTAFTTTSSSSSSSSSAVSHFPTATALVFSEASQGHGNKDQHSIDVVTDHAAAAAAENDHSGTASLDSHGHLKGTSKTKAGIGALGAVTIVCLILLFGFMIRRKFSRKRKGDGRYSHLGGAGGDDDGNSDAWKGRENGDREQGILAHEFDDFAVGDEDGPIEMIGGDDGLRKGSRY